MRHIFVGILPILMPNPPQKINHIKCDIHIRGKKYNIHHSVRHAKSLCVEYRGSHRAVQTKGEHSDKKRISVREAAFFCYAVKCWNHAYKKYKAGSI